MRLQKNPPVVGPAAVSIQPRPSGADLPQLRSLVNGYLHQDFKLMYGTPAGAVRAFLADASAAERRQLRRDWREFQKRTDSLPWAQAKRAFQELGGAWAPRSRTDLNAAFAAVT